MGALRGWNLCRTTRAEPATPEDFQTRLKAVLQTGWYCYLEDKLRFPFAAKCVAERAISPLRVGEKVEVVGMGPEGECEHEIFVEIPWEDRRLAVPLAQLKPIVKTDKDTKEAIADWHYWLDQTYEF